MGAFVAPIRAVDAPRLPDGRSRLARSRYLPATILIQVNIHQAGSATVLGPTGRDEFRGQVALT